MIGRVWQQPGEVPSSCLYLPEFHLLINLFIERICIWVASQHRYEGNHMINNGGTKFLLRSDSKTLCRCVTRIKQVHSPLAEPFTLLRASSFLLKLFTFLQKFYLLKVVLHPICSPIFWLFECWLSSCRYMKLQALWQSFRSSSVTLDQFTSSPCAMILQGS